MPNMIPPAIIQILADSTDVTTTIAKVKTQLAGLSKLDPKVLLGADSKPLQSVLAATTSELGAWAKTAVNKKIGIDTLAMQRQIFTVNSTLGGWGAIPVQKIVDLDLRSGAALASLDATIASLKAEALMQPIDIPVKVDGGGAGGLAGILSALTGGGGKGIFGMGKGLPAFGSILGLMGFGAEHVATSGIGIAGSLAGGALGGGLLGAGMAGVGAVGMGTNMAGMMQSSQDISQVVKAQDALNVAVNAFGPASYQAVQANQQLKGLIKGFPAITRPAILAAAATAHAFGAMFNKVTAPAVKVAAQIQQQAMQIGMAFLPTIGKYAAQNMGIIKKDMQPFFTWMTSMGSTKMKLPGLSGTTSIGTGGLSIFKNLEKIFQGQLPAGIKAVTGMLELFGKTIDVAAQYTGGFMKAVAKFATHMNTPKAFGGWAQEIGKLIGLFKSWMGLAGSIGGVLIALFKPALGFGKEFANMLHGMMDQLKGWLNLSSTQSNMKGLFSAHIAEVIKGIGGVLKAMLPLAESAASVFMKFAGAGARIAADLLVPLAHLLGYLGKFGPFKNIGGVLMAGFLGYKVLNGTASALKGIVTQVGLLPTRIGLMGVKIKESASYIGNMASSFASVIVSGAKWVTNSLLQILGVTSANEAGATASAGAWTAANTVMMLGIGALIAVVVVAVIEIIKHWRGLVTGLKAIWHAVEIAAIAVWDYVKKHWQGALVVLAGVVMGPVGALVVWLAEHWHTVLHDAMSVWDTVVGFLKGVGTSIVGAFKGVGTWLYDAGSQLIMGLVHGIAGAAHLAVSAVLGIAKSIWHGVTSFFGIKSPSTVFAMVGTNLMLGLAQGVTGAARVPQGAMAGAMGGMIPRGGLGGRGGMGGSSSIVMNAPINITMPAGTSPQQVGAAVQQAITRSAAAIATSMAVGSGTNY